MESMGWQPDRIRITSDFEPLLEQNVGLELDSFKRLDFLPIQNRLVTALPESRAESRSAEVLWNQEAATLVVKPPASSPALPAGGRASVDDLAAMALPVAAFIDRLQPDIVVGCDRGGRLYSLAVFGTWNQRFEERFPTRSHSVNFARLSTAVDDRSIQMSLKSIVDRNTTRQQSRKGGRKRVLTPNPRFLFIDDWIVSGATRRHIISNLTQLGLYAGDNAYFAVMCGTGADATGNSRSLSVSWHDDPEQIGIDYGYSATAEPVRSQSALKLRRKLFRAIRRLSQ